MGWSGDLYIECDRCSTDITVSIEKPDDTPEKLIEEESYYFAGTLLERVLCEDCYDIEENGEPDPDEDNDEEEDDNEDDDEGSA